MTRVCSIEGCWSKVHGRSWCKKHYMAWKSNGDPLVSRRRQNGTGSTNVYGYIKRSISGSVGLDHIRVAERAIGHALPLGAVVHHINEDKADNAPANLVICPSQAYHSLLHQRQRAFDACGHYDWRKCWVCKQYDSIVNLQIYGSSAPLHAECERIYRRAQWAKRKTQ